MMPEKTDVEASLEQKVSERLASLPDVDASAITPYVEGTKVILEGSVDTVFTARKAVLSAETVDGVHDVESHLSLTGKTDGDTSTTSH